MAIYNDETESSRLFAAGDLFDEGELTDLIDEAETEHRDRLTDELDRIDRLLTQRATIHRRIIDELVWNLERYTTRLTRLYNHGTGRDGTRTRVKDRITEIETALRQEYRAHWRDRQELEAARRTIRGELAELEEKSWSEFL